jgi:hypothetical protein
MSDIFSDFFTFLALKTHFRVGKVKKIKKYAFSTLAVEFYCPKNGLPLMLSRKKWVAVHF